MKKRKRSKNRYHSGEYKSTKTGMTAIFRSSWEYEYMVWLDSNPDVVRWESESVRIAYRRNLLSSNLSFYIPDFLIFYTDGRKELVEIKPASKRENKIVCRKEMSAIQWCEEHMATYKILTEVELKEMFVL